MFSPTTPSPRAPLSWGRIAAWTGGTVAALTLFGYFGFNFWLNRYLQSEGFRALLNEKTSALFQAQGEYLPIRRTGFSFYSDGYMARGNAGTPLKELQADQIRADIEPGAIFDGAWQVSSLQIQRLKVTLREASEKAVPLIPPSLSVQPPSETPRSSWIPDRFELKRARIEETEIAWMTALGNRGSLDKMRVILEPNGHELIAAGYGGRLQQAGWPTLSVDHMKLRFRSPELFITDSQLKLGESENINVSGQVGFGASREVALHVKFSGVSISPYLPADWRAGVKGNANGESRITGSPQSPEGLQASGFVSLTNGQLEALPILEKIANFTKTRQFRQFTMQKAEAFYTWTKSKLTVSSLIAESEGLIRMEGGFTVVAGNLDGTFQLGVAPSSLRWLPGSRARVFTQEHDGYAWTTLKISGPVNNLNEDLSERLIAAAGAEVIEGVKGTIESGAKNLFELLKPLTR